MTVGVRGGAITPYPAPFACGRGGGAPAAPALHLLQHPVRYLEPALHLQRPAHAWHSSATTPGAGLRSIISTASGRSGPLDGLGAKAVRSRSFQRHRGDAQPGVFSCQFAMATPAWPSAARAPPAPGDPASSSRVSRTERESFTIRAQLVDFRAPLWTASSCVARATSSDLGSSAARADAFGPFPWGAASASCVWPVCGCP